MDFNPVLNEIHGLSDQAKAALGMAGHTLPPIDPGMNTPPILKPGTLAPASDAAPSLVSMPHPTPTLTAGPQPPIEAPLGTIAGDEARRSTLLGQKPGVENIANNIEGSRLGQAHPLAGKILGNVAQGAGMLGDTLFKAALPWLERQIPGTEGKHAADLAKANTSLTQDEANAEKEAQTGNLKATAAHETAETPEVAPNAASTRQVQGATAEHLGAETEALKTPAFTVHDTEDGPLLVARDGTAQHLSIDGQPVGPKLKLTASPPTLGPDGKPHTYMLDALGNKKVDLGVHYERPITINNNAANTVLDREIKQFGAPHQKALTDAQTQFEKIADARAMINGNAEAQATGVPKVLTALVSAPGSGVRITQPELNSIAKARGLSGDLKGTINKWLGKGSLTKTQQQQLTGILDDVKGRIAEKAAIAQGALDKMSDPTADRGGIIQADKEARQKLSDYELKGFYVGQKVKGGTVVGFTPDGKVKVDDGR